jgi:hypothetical protein
MTIELSGHVTVSTHAELSRCTQETIYFRLYVHATSRVVGVGSRACKSSPARSRESSDGQLLPHPRDSYPCGLLSSATLSGADRSHTRLVSPRGDSRFRDESPSIVPSPTELNFPLQAKRRTIPESVYDDPRSPYHGYATFDVPPSPLTPTPRGQGDGQRRFGSGSNLHINLIDPHSQASSYEDPLPFAHLRSPANSSEGGGFRAMQASHSGLGGGASSRDKDVRTMLYQASPGALRRLARAGGGGGESQPIRPRSMAAGPPGTGKVAVAAGDGKCMDVKQRKA